MSLLELPAFLERISPEGTMDPASQVRWEVQVAFSLWEQLLELMLKCPTQSSDPISLLVPATFPDSHCPGRDLQVGFVPSPFLWVQVSTWSFRKRTWLIWLPDWVTNGSGHTDISLTVCCVTVSSLTFMNLALCRGTIFSTLAGVRSFNPHHDHQLPWYDRW